MTGKRPTPFQRFGYSYGKVLPAELVYFTHALDRVWRAHRLRQHGLDPELVDERARRRDAHIREDYRRRHGHDQD